MDRYLHNQIIKDLDRKMVFVGGPRQVGKTTMAKKIIEELQGEYLNWDRSDHRDMILRKELPDSSFWCFDEIHKYDRWRDFLKGLFDQYGKEKKILVTGSARLDYYRYSGDSLQGRYHYFRMHPLSLAEVGLNDPSTIDRLFLLGGFPEPYLENSAIEAKRWSAEYRKRLVQEDVRSLENIRNLGSLELLATRLPALVGSPLSINALREDLQISHKTVADWIDVLENLYHIFRIYPFGAPEIRAIKKEPKHYHFDWSLIQQSGPRFENMIGCHLLKWVHYRQDALGEEIDLRYFRDRDQREVDFVITLDGKPYQLIECKLSPGEISNNLIYLKKKFPQAQAIQVSLSHGGPFIDRHGIRSISASELLIGLV